MKKLKNEAQLVKMAMNIGEKYAQNRGFAAFKPTDAANDKVQGLYRLLVSDNLVQPLAKDQENVQNMKHKLALWIAKKLPQDHELLS